jgi:hypothetical protein
MGFFRDAARRFSPNGKVDAAGAIARRDVDLVVRSDVN